MRDFFLLFFILIAPLAAADFDWNIAKGFPPPTVPTDNSMSRAKVELGRHLFYDRRMSVNGKQACATCHRQELAFTDGKAHAEGTTGELHPRSSMSLVNVAYAARLTWANPTLESLEDQALIPMLGHDPIELGLKGFETRFLNEVRQDPVYRKLFPVAFPEKADPYTVPNVLKAIAAFERSIISTRSAYDRYRYGHDPNAISESAKRGEILFFSSERGGCFQCHGGWNFNGAIRYEGGANPEVEFHNTAVNRDQTAQFRAPTLRNIAVTAPYMHDGSIATLEEVLDHYASGGRFANNPNKSPIIRPFHLTDSEKHDLIEFLKSLTDQELLTDRRWSDPWTHSDGLSAQALP